MTFAEKLESLEKKVCLHPTSQLHGLSDSFDGDDVNGRTDVQIQLILLVSAGVLCHSKQEKVTPTALQRKSGMT